MEMQKLSHFAEALKKTKGVQTVMKDHYELQGTLNIFRHIVLKLCISHGLMISKISMDLQPLLMMYNNAYRREVLPFGI